MFLKRNNLLLFLLLLLAGLIGLTVYFYSQPERFTLQHISWSGPLPVDWSAVRLTEAEKKEMLTILKQPFYPLGEGHQTYAFVSKDGKTVLKFIKFSYMNSMSAVERDNRLKRLFLGYILSFQRDRDNTGLIALHQADPKGTPLTVTVDDTPLDVTPLYFILQKRVTPLKEVLNQNKSHAKEKLDKILDLYADEYKRGLYDSDHNVLYNTGFIGDRPYRLDAGRIKVLPAGNRSTFIKLDLEKILTRFRKWIVKNLPEKEQAPLLKHLQERIDQIALS